MFSICLFQGEGELRGNRGFFLPCSLRDPQCHEEYLGCSRCSVNSKVVSTHREPKPINPCAPLEEQGSSRTLRTPTWCSEVFVVLFWRDRRFKSFKQDFPAGAVDENPPASARDVGLIPGPGRVHMPHSNEAQAPQILKPECLEPLLHNKKSHSNEKLAGCNEE